MTVDLEGRVIRGVNMDLDSFRSRWKDLPNNVQNEAKLTIASLLFQNIDQLPRKLHFHQLNDKKVDSAIESGKKVNSWSLHITADDTYKASFTYEQGTLYFRTCGKHDDVDKKP